MVPQTKKTILPKDAYSAVPSTKGSPMIGRGKKLSAVEVKALRIPRTKGGSPVKGVVSFQNKENPKGYTLMKSKTFYEFYEKEDEQNNQSQNQSNPPTESSGATEVTDPTGSDDLAAVSVSSVLQKAKKQPPAPKKKTSKQVQKKDNSKKKEDSEEGIFGKISAFFKKNIQEKPKAKVATAKPSAK